MVIQSPRNDLKEAFRSGELACPPDDRPPRAAHRAALSRHPQCQFVSTKPSTFIAKGATLVEVLVALVFIAVFSAGIVGVALTVLLGNRQAQSMDIAVFLAHDQLESIRNTAYASITTATFPAEGFGTISVGKPPVPFPDYQRSVSIQDNTPASGMKRVVVTVSWRGGSVSEEMLVGQ